MIADLKMIERKVNFSEYRTLAEFIGDVTKIFENCRYFNPQGSGVAKCAESLEQFLVKQVAGVRERVSLNQWSAEYLVCFMNITNNSTTLPETVGMTINYQYVIL